MRTKNKRQLKRNIMPWFVIAIGSVILIVTLIFGKFYNKQNAVLTIDKDFVDFGDISVDTSVETTIQIKNKGQFTLKFTESPYIELKEGC